MTGWESLWVCEPFFSESRGGLSRNFGGKVSVNLVGARNKAATAVGFCSV